MTSTLALPEPDSRLISSCEGQLAVEVIEIPGGSNAVQETFGEM